MIRPRQLTLWDWAGRAYAAPGAEALCLALQNADGQSVCLLLWSAWAAQSGRAPTPEALAEAADLARAWETGVIGPLRTARRALKGIGGISDAERGALRGWVQTDELAAERALLTALEALTPAASGAACVPADAMASAAAAWGASAPRETLEALAAAICPAN